MWILALSLAAWGGTLVIDAKVPAEVSIAGLPVAKLYHASVLELPLDAGTIALTVRTGDTRTFAIDVPADGSRRVVIGRTGVTVGGAPPEEAPSTGATRVEFRAPGDDTISLRIGGERHRVGGNEPLVLDLPAGQHRVQIRNADGTVIWAQGTLDLAGGDLVVQLSEGRLPEVSGEGGVFRPDER